mmetsp:Transcript_6903/g.12033  ORF Transcript_6903/g.12033 Transcript_6903/m.12033 type:complete len:116 (-) Transcript_6903:129-476(-)
MLAALKTITDNPDHTFLASECSAVVQIPVRCPQAPSSVPSATNDNDTVFTKWLAPWDMLAPDLMIALYPFPKNEAEIAEIIDPQSFETPFDADLAIVSTKLNPDRNSADGRAPAR